MNLLQKSSWFKEYFDGLTYCIELGNLICTPSDFSNTVNSHITNLTLRLQNKENRETFMNVRGAKKNVRVL